MAKKLSLVDLLGPDDAGYEVVNAFVRAFNKNGKQWKDDYYDELNKYATDEKRRELAGYLLSNFYRIQSSKRDQIRAIYKEIKDEYGEFKGQNVPRKAEELGLAKALGVMIRTRRETE